MAGCLPDAQRRKARPGSGKTVIGIPARSWRGTAAPCGRCFHCGKEILGQKVCKPASGPVSDPGRRSALGIFLIGNPFRSPTVEKPWSEVSKRRRFGFTFSRQG
ncbi:hypothetical protein MUG91_G52n102 [Manis pentadactyla]|nr:hypothetical protein MUG91_G52n102 [Manis pentadactyla]